jgi:hypothetical protein
MTTIINATPHDIVLNNGTVFHTSGMVARVDSTTKESGEINGIKMYSVEYGDVLGLPNEEDVPANTNYIVSAMVLSALKAYDSKRNMFFRRICLSPSTTLSSTIRNDKGHIVSVEGFVI